MRIPFANRTADVDLPAAPGQPKITIKNVIDDFRAQVPSNFTALFEAFVLLSPRKVRVTCRTPRALEEVQHLGLAFRNSAVTFHPCRTAKWVNVTRLSYGVPNEALQAALSPYGKILSTKMDSYQGVYVGVRNVLMEISTPIPSNIRIADHWCNVFYQGQIPTCFKCRKSGHTRAKCPLAVNDGAAPAVDAAAEPVPILLSPARRDVVQELVGSVLDRVVTGPATFAEVVRLGVEAAIVEGPELNINSDVLGLDPGQEVETVVQQSSKIGVGAGSASLESLAQDLLHSSSESSDSEDDDLFEEVPCVVNSLTGKRAHSSGTSSDESDSGLSPAQKKGKEIHVGLLAMQGPQGEGEVVAVDAAAKVPLPTDVDDEFASNMDLKTDTPQNSVVDTELSSEMDLPSTKIPKPTSKHRGVKSQSSSDFVPFCKRTTPNIAGTGCYSSRPPSRGSNR